MWRAVRQSIIKHGIHIDQRGDCLPSDHLRPSGGLFRPLRRPEDGAAVPFRHGVRELRHPKPIPRCTKASQHVAMLVAGLGGGKCWQGEGRHTGVHNGRHRKLCPGVGIAVTPMNRPGFVGGSNFQIGWSRYEQDDEQILP